METETRRSRVSDVAERPRGRRCCRGEVLAAGRSERIRSITGGGSKAQLRLGGLSLVERRDAICWDSICLRSQQ